MQYISLFAILQFFVFDPEPIFLESLIVPPLNLWQFIAQGVIRIPIPPDPAAVCGAGAPQTQ